GDRRTRRAEDNGRQTTDPSTSSSIGSRGGSGQADGQPTTDNEQRTNYDLRFGEATLRHLIHAYTYEAGVRNLEREIGAICRKIARRVAEGRPVPRVVRPAQLGKYLGPPRHTHGLAELRDEVGIATGMFWT